MKNYEHFLCFVYFKQNDPNWCRETLKYVKYAQFALWRPKIEQVRKKGIYKWIVPDSFCILFSRYLYYLLLKIFFGMHLLIIIKIAPNKNFCVLSEIIWVFSSLWIDSAHLYALMCIIAKNLIINALKEFFKN